MATAGATGINQCCRFHAANPAIPIENLFRNTPLADTGQTTTTLEDIENPGQASTAVEDTEISGQASTAVEDAENPGQTSTGLLDTSVTALSFAQVEEQVGLRNLWTAYTLGVHTEAMAPLDAVSLPMKIVDEVDNFLYLNDDPEKYKEFMYHFYRLYVKGIPKPLGFVHGSIIVELPWPDYWMYSSKSKSLLFSGGKDATERTKLLRETLLAAKDKAWKAKEPDMPLDPLRQMRGIPRPIFSSDGEHVMDIDHAAAEMFGAPSYNFVLIAWMYTEGHRYYWFPRLAKTNADYPDKLSHIAVGLLTAGDDHTERVKEIAEAQCGLPKNVTSLGMKSVDTVSYITHKHKGSFLHTIQPFVQYVYEIQLDEDVRPTHTADCQPMQMYSFAQVWALLLAGEFDSHSQMSLLAHMIRHGYIDAGSEPQLQEIQTRLHRRIEFPEI